MAASIRWYKAPQLVLIYIGLGLLLFLFGFGLGKWFGSESDQNQSDLIFAELKTSGDKTVKIYGRDVLPQLDSQLRGLEREKYRIKRQLVEDLLFEKANLEKVTPEVEVSESDLKDFAAQRGQNLAGLTAQRKKDLEGNFRILKSQKAARDAHQAKLAEGEVIWGIPLTYLRPKQSIAIGGLAPVPIGRGNGSIVVFANYHCPTCAGLWRKLGSLSEETRYGGKLHVRFNVSDGDAAIVRIAALGGFCANDQGRFLEYHRAMVASPPSELGEFHRALGTLASAGNFSKDIFETCVSAKATEKRLERDVLDAISVGLPGQALAVINGRPIEAEEPLAEFLLLLGK